MSTPRWRGEYPPDWPAISRAVKEAAGWRCIRCGHPDPPDGERRGYAPEAIDRNQILDRADLEELVRLKREDLSRPEVEARLEELLTAGQPWRAEAHAF